MQRRRTQRKPRGDNVPTRRGWPPAAGGSKMRPRSEVIHTQGQLTLTSGWGGSFGGMRWAKDQPSGVQEKLGRATLDAMSTDN